MNTNNQKKEETTNGSGKSIKQKLFVVFLILASVAILLFALKPWRLMNNPKVKEFSKVLTGEKLIEGEESSGDKVEEASKKDEGNESEKESTESTGDDWWEEALDRPAELKSDSEKEIFIPITPPASGEERPDTELASTDFEVNLLKLINDFRKYEGMAEVSTDADLWSQAQQKSSEAALRGIILDNYIVSASSITYLGLAGAGVESMVVQENLNETSEDTYMNPRWRKIGIGTSLGSFGGNEQIVWAVILTE